MNEDHSVGGIVRPRPDEDGEHDRSVRQNLGNYQLPVRPNPFMANVELNMNNIEVSRSQTAGVLQRRPFNPNSQLISLHNLVTNGSQHRTNMMLIILSINSVSASSPTQVQQRYNGSRGQVNTIRHDRRMVVMCPLSPEGSNTAMIYLDPVVANVSLTAIFLFVVMERYVSCMLCLLLLF